MRRRVKEHAQAKRWHGFFWTQLSYIDMTQKETFVLFRSGGPNLNEDTPLPPAPVHSNE